jgi:hypothetical protein
MPKKEENAKRSTPNAHRHRSLPLLELGAFALKSDRMLGVGVFLQPAPPSTAARTTRLRQGYGAAGRL